MNGVYRLLGGVASKKQAAKPRQVYGHTVVKRAAIAYREGIIILIMG